MNKQDEIIATWQLVVGSFVVLAWVGGWVGVIYILTHFILKYW